MHTQACAQLRRHSAHTCNKPPTHIHTCTHTHKPALSSYLQHAHAHIQSCAQLILATCTYTQACAQLIPATSPPRTCTLAYIHTSLRSAYTCNMHTHTHEPALSSYLQQAPHAHTHLHTYTQACAQLILATCTHAHTHTQAWAQLIPATCPRGWICLRRVCLHSSAPATPQERLGSQTPWAKEETQDLTKVEKELLMCRVG